MSDLRLVAILFTVILGYVVTLETFQRIMRRNDALSGIRQTAVCQCSHTAYLHDHKTGTCTQCFCPTFRKRLR